MAISFASPDILIAQQRRLEKLELRATIQGIETPPEVLTEIDSLKAQIAVAAPTTTAESHPLVMQAIQSVEARFNARFDRLYWFMLALAAVIILAVRL